MFGHECLWIIHEWFTHASEWFKNFKKGKRTTKDKDYIDENLDDPAPQKDK